MEQLSDLVKTADWHREKHAPVIDCPEHVKAGASFDVEASIGKEIAHPNTTEHHIAWIALHFLPAGTQIPYEVGRFLLSAHGQSAKGANEGPVHAMSKVQCSLQLKDSGTLYATSYCNIHGLWESAREITVG